MKKTIYGLLVPVVLCSALFVPGVIQKASAEVNVSINIGPPPIVVAAPPALVMVPNSEIFFVPDPEIDVFFFNGFWWSPRGSEWYRSTEYKGPWKIIDKRHIPASVFHVPKNYRHLYKKEKHIPYGQWKKQWKNHKKDEHRTGKPRKDPRWH